jgi:hypothetical protein
MMLFRRGNRKKSTGANFPGFSDLLPEVSKFQHHIKLYSKCSILLVSFSVPSPFCTYVYVHKYPTKCKSSILFYCKITQHVSGTLRAHHQKYINCSWQSLVWHTLRWIVNFVVASTLSVLQNRAVGHITVVELKLNHGYVLFVFWYQSPNFGDTPLLSWLSWPM